MFGTRRSGSYSVRHLNLFSAVANTVGIVFLKIKRMRLRNNHRKSPSYNSNAGGKCSLHIMIWSLAGCILMIHFYSNIYRKEYRKENQQKVTNITITQELEKVEEESFQVPSHKSKKRSTRAVSKKGGRNKQPSAVSEFLDESSELQSYFFPDKRSAVGPAMNESDSMYFYPGRLWLDTDGNPIQAHGGGIMFDEKAETYYWYGENKDGETYHAHKKAAARVDIIGVSCYSSKDLRTWTNEGIALPGQETNTTHDLHKFNVLERPKVMYNHHTNKYVMYMHIDNANYTKASIGVATSNSPKGPFNYLHSKRPHGFESRDMTVFKDDDGRAYLIYSSEHNNVLHISPLTDDYLEVTSVVERVLVGQKREAPVVFKHDKVYYMITSGCSGWAPNEALTHASESIMGPWESMGNPCVGGNGVFRMTTYFAQGSFVLPLPGVAGFYVFMADRWKPSDLRDSRYVWLPLSVGGLADEAMEYGFGFPTWPRVSIYWHKKWRARSV